jgi:hypothetical protein
VIAGRADSAVAAGAALVEAALAAAQLGVALVAADSGAVQARADFVVDLAESDVGQAGLAEQESEALDVAPVALVALELVAVPAELAVLVPVVARVEPGGLDFLETRGEPVERVESGEILVHLAAQAAVNSTVFLACPVSKDSMDSDPPGLGWRIGALVVMLDLA